MAGSPQLVVPITPELEAIPAVLSKVRAAGYGEDGTAMGSAIGSAVNRLRAGPWSQRRILLVTDGVNNRGALAPLDAALIAAGLGIRIDTIGIGTSSISRYWVPTADGPPIEVSATIQIDDASLEEVSRIAGGAYHRVVNSNELRQVLESLKPVDAKTREVLEESYDFGLTRYLAFAAMALICLEFACKRFLYPELPG
jgi:Ca-activated chloride channel family protein